MNHWGGSKAKETHSVHVMTEQQSLLRVGVWVPVKVGVRVWVKVGVRVWVKVGISVAVKVGVRGQVKVWVRGQLGLAFSWRIKQRRKTINDHHFFALGCSWLENFAGMTALVNPALFYALQKDIWTSEIKSGEVLMISELFCWVFIVSMQWSISPWGIVMVSGQFCMFTDHSLLNHLKRVKRIISK